MTFTVFVFLFIELGVATSKLVIGDIRIDTVSVQVLHVFLVGKPRISGDDSLRFQNVIADRQAFKPILNTF